MNSKYNKRGKRNRDYKFKSSAIASPITLHIFVYIIIKIFSDTMDADNTDPELTPGSDLLRY
jgi:hypothetical protein